MYTYLPLTTTMVSSKNPNKSSKNPALPPGLQDSFQHVGEPSDSSNLLSRASSRAGKWVYLRGRPQTHCIARHSSRSVSASSASRNVFPDAVTLSSPGKNEEKDMNLDPKTPTVPKVTTDRFSFKKVSFLKLSATFPASILEETAFNIGWNN